MIAGILVALAVGFTWTLARATAQRETAERAAFAEQSNPFRK
jgi:hypothetical protein